MDLSIVVVGWVVKLSSKGVDIKTLRLLRILRPLKSISAVQGMKEIFMVLANCIKPLASTFLVIVLFLQVFAICGLNLWMGLLHSRCFDLDTGAVDVEAVCGNAECQETEKCGLLAVDTLPSFDDIFKSFIITFQCVTLESWSDVFNTVERANSVWSAIYFLPLVFLGAFLFLNLTLAVVQMKFASTMEKVKSTQALRLRTAHFTMVGTMQADTDEITAYDPVPETSLRRMSLQDSVLSIQVVSLKQEESESLHPSLSVKGPDSHLFHSRFSEPSNLPPEDNSHSLRPEDNSQVSERLQFSSDSLLMSPDQLQRADLLIDLTRMQQAELVHDTPLSAAVLSFSKDDPLREFQLRYHFWPPALDLACKSDVLDTTVSPTEHQATLRFEKFERNCKKFDSDPLELFFSTLGKAESMVMSAFAQETTVSKWSGEEVHPNRKVKAKPLPELRVNLWGRAKTFRQVRFLLRRVLGSQAFSLCMVGVVLLNTVVLTLYYYNMPDDQRDSLDKANSTLTFVLTAELCMRLLAYGLRSFVRDVLNLLDLGIVTLSLVELLYFSQNSSLSALKTVIVLRSLRVFKVVRVLRYLRAMSTIVEVLGRASLRSVYLVLLLVLFIVIFALVGRQLFEGELGPTAQDRAGFDTFFHAFLTVFQVLTIENWDSLLYRAINTSLGQYSFIYFFVWIVLGNFVLLNLFLAILLDAFSVISQEQEEKKAAEALAATIRPVQRPAARIISKMRNSQLADLLAHVERQPSDSFAEIREQLHRATTIEDPWAGIAATRSFCLFSKENWVRCQTLRLIKSSRFEFTVLLFIIFNCGELVWETTLMQEETKAGQDIASRSLNIAFTVVFSVEALLRALAQGFALAEGSYLRDSWNLLDFTILLVSVVELNFTDVHLGYVKVVRALRTIRALRMVSRNLSMKLVVQSLLQSIMAIANAGFVLTIIWVIFAILGVSMFGGRFRSCEGVAAFSESECLYYGSKWTDVFNFDNVAEAMMSLFIIGTGDNWPDFMYNAIDSGGEGQLPRRDAEPLAAAYFVVYVMLTTFFLMNLFTGLLIDKYQEAKKQKGTWTGIFLSAKQLKWVKLQELIPKAKVTPSNPTPQNRVRRWCFLLTSSPHFELGAMLCIVLNMVALSCPYFGMSETYSTVLDVVNLIFTMIFLLEAGVKLLAQGCSGYFAQSWNVFDFVVVICSLVEIAISNALSGQAKLLRVAPQMIRVARVLRISRLFRLARFLSDLQALLQAVIYALPSILNVFLLLLLIYFVYAVLGVFLFYDMRPTVHLDDYFNFRSFPRALLLVIRMSTGENWSLMMRDCAAVSPWLAYPYFLSYITITNFLMLNLFVMVMIQSVEDHFENPESYVDLYSRSMAQVQGAWQRFCSSEYRLHYRALLEFLYTLGPPLGEDVSRSRVEVMREIIAMGIPMDEHGFIFFHELLFCLFRRAYGSFSLDPRKDKLLLYLINKEEAKTLKEIAVQKRKLLTRPQSRPQRGDWHVSANPFLAVLHMRRVFSGWKSLLQGKRTKERARDRRLTHQVLSRTPQVEPRRLQTYVE